ncbi:precorrin-4 C(11)-methyltransferase [Streptomyces roseoverticillatus]|uniref:precorrin-4 C(11)-methyltransferase n=1 Tax=Streptomyces roseoverticillatus TaxID=66429 RepID=UPI001EEEB4EE|nr:precorrin-4 C(11)-methyltransferase [Streptomyces roseoverticillatus]MCF3103588.1 precorrin-4 C(11)-methyltransferase [Streptomyces roseoverticillatus]
MTVYFIGAGPGAADLITVRGARTLARCGVCLYAGSLVPRELLAECPPDARLVDTAGLTLDQITEELTRAHAAGQDVARLHSGDPSVFSAVAEQMRRLDAAGIPYEIVPGVPAFAAAAAALGRELTVPTVGQTVILTRIARQATPMPPGEDLATLGRSGALLVLHLAARYTDEVVAELLPHYGADCPAAVVAMASRPDELVLRGTLADIAEKVKGAGVVRTAVIIVGRTLAAEQFPDSYLYSADRDRNACGKEG